MVVLMLSVVLRELHRQTGEAAGVIRLYMGQNSLSQTAPAAASKARSSTTHHMRRPSPSQTKPLWPTSQLEQLLRERARAASWSGDQSRCVELMVSSAPACGRYDLPTGLE